MNIVAKTFYGLEEVVAEELRELGAERIQLGNRAVLFEGDKKMLYTCNLWLRTAIALLVPIRQFAFENERDFKRQLGAIHFDTYMSHNRTFAVKGAVHSRLFSHSKYPLLLLKDAIVDFFRDANGHRPSVDTQYPDNVFDVHIEHQQCTISLNSSGAPLFQRGYRTSAGIAPLNEVMAAGLILLSGWDKKSHFTDLFCGSGTLPIEAALMASGIPPNIARKHYAFHHWPDYDHQLWQTVYESAPSTPRRDLNFAIVGSDTDGEMIKKARNNCKALPLGKTLSFKARDFRDTLPAEGGGTLISNLPYGERLKVENTEALYQSIGQFFKRQLPGYTCWVLSANREALKHIGLRPSKKILLHNGSMNCDFRKYEVFEGSMVEHKYGNETGK